MESQHYFPMKTDVKDTKNGLWWVYGSSYENYLKDFMEVQAFPDEIINRLRQKEKPVVIDLLASTGALRSLAQTLKPTKFKGLAVGFHDSRDPDEINEDLSNGIEYIAGDLSDRTTWDKIDAWLGEEKADFIMSRAVGGLHRLPTNLGFAGHAIHRVWNALNPENGIAILQIPPAYDLGLNGIPSYRWVSKLRTSASNAARYVGTYNFQGDLGHLPYGLLRLNRIPGVEFPKLKVFGRKTTEEV